MEWVGTLVGNHKNININIISVWFGKGRFIRQILVTTMVGFNGIWAGHNTTAASWSGFGLVDSMEYGYGIWVFIHFIH